MGRVLCLLWVLSGCYSTSPQEGLPCSNSGKCPSGLSCDADTFTCTSHPTPGAPFDKISAGETHTCAIDPQGALWCWGDNSSGQLGTGDATPRSLPTAVVSTNGWQVVSAGDRATCALDGGGDLYCWGSADVVSSFSNVPKHLDGKWLSVSVGVGGFCAVDDQHGVWCGWNGDTLQKRTDAPLADTVWASNGHACALDNTGTLYCFGANDQYQGGNVGDPLPPTTVSGKWTSVATSADHTCAINTDSHLFCWGACDHNETGKPRGQDPHCLPAQVDDSKYLRVATGGDSTCAIDADKQLVCFGANDRGQLARTTIEPFDLPGKAAVTQDFESISMGGRHGCATIASHLTTYCWGDNAFGQLGTGEVAHYDTPTQVSGGWLDVSAGLMTTCAISSDSAVFCWGYNGAHELASPDGGTTSDSSPGFVASGYSQVSVGASHVCGLKTATPANELWCWGSNQGGQLGLGSTSDVTEKVPVKVGDKSDWTEVQAGNDMTCGIRGDVGMFCWGAHNDMALSPVAIDTTTPGYVGLDGNASLFPVMIDMFAIKTTTTPQLSTVDTMSAVVDNHVPAPGTKVAARGSEHDCAIDNAGKLLCWGFNNYGEVGRPTSGNDLAPGQVTGGGMWKDVDAGGYATCAIKSDDTLWCWGRAATLGSKTVSLDNPMPTQVDGNAKWKKISVGEHHACAVKMDNTLWCWGDNPSGELGGKPTGHARPVKVHPQGAM